MRLEAFLEHMVTNGRRFLAAQEGGSIWLWFSKASTCYLLMVLETVILKISYKIRASVGSSVILRSRTGSVGH